MNRIGSAAFPNRMSRYRITLHDAAGAIVAEHMQIFADDDAAIDLAGSLDHTGSLTVHDGARLVARFAPLAPWLAH